MYRLILAALLSLSLALPAEARRANEGAFTVTEWGGIVDNRDTGRMDARDAIDAANVLTDNDRLEVMPGMEELVAEVLANFPVRGLYPYTDSSGNKFLLFHASATIYQTNLGAVPAALENVSDSVETDSVQAFTRIYFSNRSDSAWSWDGTSTAAVSAMPLCKYLEFAHERIYCGNVSTNNSTVNVSSFGGANFWTIPSNVSEIPDAPNSFTFQSNDGDAINCLKLTPWGMFIGKRRSSHILKGFDNETYYKRVVSPTIGCVDDRLVQMVDGKLTWLSDDGVYQWVGSGKPNNISDDVENRMALIRQLTAQADSYNISSQAKWETGSSNVSPLIGTWSTTIVDDSIVPSTITRIDTSSTDFAGGTVDFSSVTIGGSVVFLQGSSATFTNAGGESSDATTNWTQGGVAWTNTTGGVGAAYGSRFWVGAVRSAAESVRFDVLDTVAAGGGTLYTETRAVTDGMSATEFQVDTSTLPLIVRIQLTNISAGSDATAVSSNFIRGSSITYSIFDSGAGGGIIAAFDIPEGYLFGSSFTGEVMDFALSTPTWGSFVVDMTSGPGAGAIITFEVQSSTDPDDTFETLTAQTPDEIVAAASGRRYARYKISTVVDCTTCTTENVNSVTLIAASTGYYSSAVQFIGEDISSFGTGHFTTVESPTGNISYETRAATFSFVSTNTVVSWTAFTNNTTVSHSTGAYFQFRITSLIDSATQQLEVNRFLLNWSEGEAPAAASLVFERRYFMCVTISTSSTVNDSCEVYQRNKKWTRITGKSIGSMTIFDNDPVAGDGSTGSEVWTVMREGVEDYAGTAIDAYWVTKDFMGFSSGQQTSDPHAEKILNEIWIDADSDSGKVMTVGYAANKSGVFISTTTTLDSTSNYINKNIPIDATFVLGNYLRFRFSNGNAIGNNFLLNAYTAYGEDKARTQD